MENISMDYRLIRHLASFKVVAEELHFGRAAKRLGISQPPLSQQIMALENQLGVQLFERSRAGVTLTTAGQQILPSVDTFLSEGKRLESAVMEARVGRTTRINVGAIAFTMAELLPGLLSKARSQMADASFYIHEFDSNEALDALENEEIDIAFLRAEENTGSLKVMPLVREGMVLGLPQDHPMASKRRIKLQDLAGEPMVYCPRDISPSYFDRIMTICRSHGLIPRLAFEARSITSQLAFIGCGTAIGLVPESMRAHGHHGIRFVTIEGDTNVVTAAVAWRENNRNPAVQEFLDIALA